MKGPFWGSSCNTEPCIAQKEPINSQIPALGPLGFTRNPSDTSKYEGDEVLGYAYPLISTL